MDATSSYQAATKIDQTPLQSAQEIYVQAVSSGGELQSAAGFDGSFDSSDNVTAGSGGSTRSSGIRLFPNTASESFVSIGTILASYDPATDDDWSVNLTISSGVFNGTIGYSDDTALYNATGSSQTVYRIPIVRDEVFVATYGAYAEKTVCINGESVVQFIHI
tara:strand:- start:214 stop:702 length:489 start_codon:yes stop_codon:yes gene_type:complete